MTDELFKVCWCCDARKPIAAFKPCKRAKDGRVGICRACAHDRYKLKIRKKPEPAPQPNNIDEIIARYRVEMRQVNVKKKRRDVRKAMEKGK